MDLDKLLLKTSEQLDPNEKDFIRANRDKLNEEDNAAYKDFLDAGEPDVPVAPVEPVTPDPAPVAPVEPAAAAPVAPETPPSYQFKTEAEAKEFVRKQFEENEKAKKAAIDAATTPAEKKYVEDNWNPNSWNEAIATTAKTVKEELKAEMKAEAEATEKRMKAHGERLQKEWEDVSKANSIPAITTAEGREIHDAIVKVAQERRITNFKDAHLAWSQLPKEFGGGYDPVAAQAKLADDTKKAALAAQKKAATKISGASGEGNTPNPQATGALKPTKEQFKKARSTNELLQSMGLL